MIQKFSIKHKFKYIKVPKFGNMNLRMFACQLKTSDALGMVVVMFLYGMSFQKSDTTPSFLTSCSSDQSLLPFKFKIFVLNISLFSFILHFV